MAGIFSGNRLDVPLSMDSGAAAFLKPFAIGQGQTLAKWIEALVYKEVARLATDDSSSRVSHAERAVLSALLMHIRERTQRLDVKGVPWVGRSWLAARTGLSKVAIGHCVQALEASGDLISKVSAPEKGRRGPIPLVYSFSPKGAQRAFHLEPESPELLAAIDTWEDLIGYPGKGETKPAEEVTYPPGSLAEAAAQEQAVNTRDLETCAVCPACEEPESEYEHLAGCANG